MEAEKAAGNKAMAKGKFKDALRHYRKALSVADPSRIQDVSALHSNASLALVKMGQHEEGHFRKGEALFRVGKYTEAGKAYAEALKLAPDDSGIKSRLGLTKEALTGFYFRQINSSAVQMLNFVYLIGDAKSREVFIVDAAWDTKGLIAFADSELVKIVGAVVTHHHFDHTGGLPPPPYSYLGIRVPGIREMAEKCKVYVHREDAKVLHASNLVPLAAMEQQEHKSVISVGSLRITCLHTPGHTKGSQCLYLERVPGRAEGVLLTGDTLFISSCGKLDPECGSLAMYHSLVDTLAHLPDSTRVYPGHDYGGSSTTIGLEKTRGMLRKRTEQQWVELHAQP